MQREVDWQTIFGDVLRRLHASAGAWTQADIDDAVQDGLVVLLHLWEAGVEVRDPTRLACAVARRRLLDGRRRMRRRDAGGVELDELAPPEPEERQLRGWREDLRKLGIIVTENRARLLDAIVSGARATKDLARILGRDPKTIRESRQRLQRWLESLIPPL